MIQVQKQDLKNTYKYQDLVEKRKKEISKWKWIVLIGCLLFQMLPYCVALNLANVFAGSDWLVWVGFDPTLLNLTFTVGALGAALVGPSIAKWFGKPINMRVVYSIGVILAMAGFIILGVDSAIYNSGNTNKGLLVVLLWIPTIITQVGVMIFSGLGVNNLISKWWEPEKRGFALGIAFAGGSLGNIWMQQLVGVLSKKFGNVIFWDDKTIPGKDIPLYGHLDVNDAFIGNQWVTYLILGAMGLITGLLITFVVCRKPVPPISMFDTAVKGAKIQDTNTQATKPILEASPLDTKKYPPYWILAVGYLILQMGTVHASANGQIIQNTIAVAYKNLNYNDIMAIGGTLFGVSCLIGNVGGGIVNDKLGPTKSISLAGTVQVGAILCLLFSVQTPGLVYAYFILAGLSVYIYTSTPAFLCGRLYGAGQSNNQMAILGVFIAVGFAIVNSISGSLMGDLDKTSVILGQTTNGTMLNLEIFAIVCMAVGTIIVATCSAIITKKGIKGLLEYSPSKYSNIMFFKHNLAISFSASRIFNTKKDFRKSEERIAKIKAKNEKTKNFHAFDKFEEAMNEFLSKSKVKLTDNQKKILSIIFYNKYIDGTEFGDIYKLNNIEDDLNALIKNKMVERIKLLPNDKDAFKLSDELNEKLSDVKATLFNKYSDLANEERSIDDKIVKLNNKLANKQAKLSEKLTKIQNTEIDQNKQAKLTEKANKKIAKLEEKQSKKMEALANCKDEWKKFNTDYFIAEKILTAESLKSKLAIKKENNIKETQKKIGVAAYTNSFDKYKQIEGHNLMLNYLNDVYGTCDALIDKRLNDTFERKIGIQQRKIDNSNAKLNKLSLKEKKIEASR